MFHPSSSFIRTCIRVHPGRIDNHHTRKCQSPNASFVERCPTGWQARHCQIEYIHTYIHTHTHVYTQVSLVTASLVPRWQNVAGNRRSGGDRCDRASPALTERSSSCARPFTRPLLAPFVVRSLRGPLFVSLRLCREYLWKLEVREKERERERERE